MAEQGGSQLALRMLENIPPIASDTSVSCSRVDPNHPAYAASVDESGILRYIFLGEGGSALVVAAFELLFCQPGPSGDPMWQPVRRQWSGFALLPRCTSQELLLCRADSNKLLYTRLPASAQQPQDVYHFGSHIGNITAFHVQPDGERVLSGCEQGVLKLWSLSSGKQLAINDSAHRGPITALCSVGANKFASGGRDGAVLVWDSGSRALSVVHSLSVACASPVSSLEVFDGQKRLESGRAAAMPWRRGGDIDPPPDPCLGCEKAEQGPPRTLLAAGTGAGGLYVWSCVVDRWVHGCGTTMCQVCVDHTARGAAISALAFSLGGETLAASSSGPRHLPQQMLPDFRNASIGVVRVYDTERWRCREVLHVNGGVPRCLKFVPGERALADGSGLPRLLFTAPSHGGAQLIPSWAHGGGGLAEDDEDGAVAASGPLGPPQVQGLLEGDPVRTQALLQGPWEPDLPSRGTTPCSSPTAADKAARSLAENAAPPWTDERPRPTLPPGPTAQAAPPIPPHAAQQRQERQQEEDRDTAMTEAAAWEMDEEGSATPVPRSMSSVQRPQPLVMQHNREEEEPRRGLRPSALPRPFSAEHRGGQDPLPRAGGQLPAPVNSNTSGGRGVGGARGGLAPEGVHPRRRGSEMQQQQQQGQPVGNSGPAAAAAAAGGQPLVVRHLRPPPSAAFALPSAAEQGGKGEPKLAALDQAQQERRTLAPLPSNAGFVADTANSAARKQVVASRHLQNNDLVGEVMQSGGSPGGGSAGGGLPGDPGLNSTRILLGKISRAEAEQFPAEEVLPAARAAAAGEAARGAMPQGGFSGLVPVDDTIQASQQRAVPKQLDSRWVASRQKAPRVEDLWAVEDRLPGVVNTEVNLPLPVLTREDVVDALLSIPYYSY